jgi:selT/selW/selH-like putative selenoprotein
VIEERHGIASTLKPGATGEFTVWRDGAKIWDKHERGRFPEAREILDQLG